MHRFYIPPARWNLDAPVLDAGEAHHCTDVLRLAAGDRVTLFNGQGAEATAQITSIARDAVALRRTDVPPRREYSWEREPDDVEAGPEAMPDAAPDGVAPRLNS